MPLSPGQSKYDLMLLPDLGIRGGVMLQQVVRDADGEGERLFRARVDGQRAAHVVEAPLDPERDPYRNLTAVTVIRAAQAGQRILDPASSESLYAPSVFAEFKNRRAGEIITQLVKLNKVPPAVLVGSNSNLSDGTFRFERLDVSKAKWGVIVVHSVTRKASAMPRTTTRQMTNGRAWEEHLFRSDTYPLPADFLKRDPNALTRAVGPFVHALNTVTYDAPSTRAIWTGITSRVPREETVVDNFLEILARRGLDRAIWMSNKRATDQRVAPTAFRLEHLGSSTVLTTYTFDPESGLFVQSGAEMLKTGRRVADLLREARFGAEVPANESLQGRLGLDVSQGLARGWLAVQAYAGSRVRVIDTGGASFTITSNFDNYYVTPDGDNSPNVQPSDGQLPINVVRGVMAGKLSLTRALSPKARARLQDQQAVDGARVATDASSEQRVTPAQDATATAPGTGRSPSSRAKSAKTWEELAEPPADSKSTTVAVDFEAHEANESEISAAQLRTLIEGASVQELPRVAAVVLRQIAATADAYLEQTGQLATTSEHMRNAIVTLTSSAFEGRTNTEFFRQGLSESHRWLEENRAVTKCPSLPETVLANSALARWTNHGKRAPVGVLVDWINDAKEASMPLRGAMLASALQHSCANALRTRLMALVGEDMVDAEGRRKPFWVPEPTTVPSEQSLSDLMLDVARTAEWLSTDPVAAERQLNVLEGFLRKRTGMSLEGRSQSGEPKLQPDELRAIAGQLPVLLRRLSPLSDEDIRLACEQRLSSEDGTGLTTVDLKVPIAIGRIGRQEPFSRTAAVPSVRALAAGIVDLEETRLAVAKMIWDDGHADRGAALIDALTHSIGEGGLVHKGPFGTNKSSGVIALVNAGRTGEEARASSTEQFGLLEKVDTLLRVDFQSRRLRPSAPMLASLVRGRKMSNDALEESLAAAKLEGAKRVGRSADDSRSVATTNQALGVGTDDSTDVDRPRSRPRSAEPAAETTGETHSSGATSRRVARSHVGRLDAASRVTPGQPSPEPPSLLAGPGENQGPEGRTDGRSPEQDDRSHEDPTLSGEAVSKSEAKPEPGGGLVLG